MAKSNQISERKDRGGLVVGDSHAEGGVPFKLTDTGTHIEEEGDEVNVPREIADSDVVYEFEGTNYEILDKILKLGNLSLNNKVTEVKSGDIVICIKSTWDDTPRKYKGTVRQILSAINESKGCNHIESGATMTNLETGATVSMKNGGVVKYENILDMPRGERIELIIKSLRGDLYYSEERGNFELIAEKANEIIEKYFQFNKENPIYIKGDKVYFEPDSRMVKRDGYVVAQAKYGTHLISFTPDKIIRFYDKQKVRNIDVISEVIKNPDERFIQKNGNIVYLKKVSVNNSCCSIFRFEVNADGNLTMIGLMPEQKDKDVQKKKASGFWSDAPFGHFPPKLPSEKVTPNISGSSDDDTGVHNKDKNNGDMDGKNLRMGGNVENLIKIIEKEGKIRWKYQVEESAHGGSGSAIVYDYNDRAYEIITWNEDAKQHKAGEKTLAIESNREDDSKVERVKNIVEKIWSATSPIGLNIDERTLLESLVMNYIGGGGYITKRTDKKEESKFDRLVRKKIISINPHKGSSYSTAYQLTDSSQQEVQNAVENEGMSRGGKTGDKNMVTIYQFFGSWLQDGQLYAPFAYMNNHWTGSKEQAEKVFNKAGLHSFLKEDLEKVKNFYRDGVLLFELQSTKIPKSAWENRDKEADRLRYETVDEYINYISDYDWETIKERAIYQDGEAVSKKELEEYFETYENGGVATPLEDAPVNINFNKGTFSESGLSKEQVKFLKEIEKLWLAGDLNQKSKIATLKKWSGKGEEMLDALQYWEELNKPLDRQSAFHPSYLSDYLVGGGNYHLQINSGGEFHSRKVRIAPKLESLLNGVGLLYPINPKNYFFKITQSGGLYMEYQSIIGSRMIASNVIVDYKKGGHIQSNPHDDIFWLITGDIKI